MKQELVCIVCPRGCKMAVDNQQDQITVTGNFCKKGEQFAKDEMTNPIRTICTTVKTSYKDVPVVPVRVSKDIPKNKIFPVMEEINNFVLSMPVKRGEAIIKNILNLGVDIIVTSDILADK